MRAKLIYEKFTEKSDPVKDMNIGFKDHFDYVEKRLKEHNLSPDKYWLWWLEMMEGDNRPQDLLELMLEILKNTPIEYQLHLQMKP